MTDVRFAYGKTLSGVVTRTEPWDKIARVIAGKLRVYASKADSTNAPNILGGPTDNKGKEDRNVLARSLLTLDFDDLPDDFEPDDMAFTLDMLSYSCVAYSTFSHKTERADGRSRLRVIVLLEREIPKSWYAAAVRSFVDDLGIECSPESYTVAQVMFLHSAMEGHEHEAWTQIVDGVPYPVQDAWAEGVEAGGDDLDDLDEMLQDIAYEPMDVTWAEVDKTLELFPAEGLEYDDWLMVGLGLWHQSRGSVEDDGLGRWLAWSRQSSKHDGKLMRKKWKSMGGRRTPVTMASVFARVGGLGVVREALEGMQEADEGGEVAKSGPLALLDKLSARAQDVNTLEEYEAFKKALQRLPESRLGSDYRGMIAEELFSGWGKSAKFSKADIKKALMPDRSSVKTKRVGLNGGAGEDGGDVITEADCWNEEYPKWLQGWVYDEVGAEFVQLRTGHAIKREPFGMKFDRRPECAEHEVGAASLASSVFPIPTVAGRMYWPGEGKVFQDRKGLTYINTWLGDGGGTNVVVPERGAFSVGDDSVEGQACELFLKHLELTVADPRERELMLDWMAFVYANPGARVRWALLLWGIEGNGKSYFHRVLGRLMGQDSRTVTASLIEERFTDWAEGCRLIGIEEIRVSGTNKWRTLDKMKPFISNDEIQVEGKGMKAHVVPNFASYMLFTNHIDAIPVTEGDRRYFVVFTRHRTKQELLDQHGGDQGVKDYFQRLFDVSLAGAGGIGRMLLDRQYGAEFDPNGRAPDSRGREEMRMMHVTEEDEAVTDALDRYRGPHVNELVIDITQLQDDCLMDGSEIELPKTKSLAYKLSEMGYARGNRVKARGKLRTFWYRPNRISEDEARVLVQSKKGFEGFGGAQ
jgi:hypothetical protein